MIDLSSNQAYYSGKSKKRSDACWAQSQKEKTQLNQISDRISQEKEVKSDETLRKENEKLKANSSKALNWINAAEERLDKSGMLDKFKIWLKYTQLLLEHWISDYFIMMWFLYMFD